MTNIARQSSLSCKKNVSKFYLCKIICNSYFMNK